jgi:lipid-binding SYLF domain-containing protein
MEFVMYPALRSIRNHLLFLVCLTAVALASAYAAPAKDLDAAAAAALKKLYAEAPATKALGDKGKAVIVFPEIYKAALLGGGQSGKGAMFQDGRIVGHYSIRGLAAGLEAGAQRYSYALFLMTDEAVERLKRSEGFKIGVEPNIVMLNTGAGANVSTATAHRDVYAYVFDTHGLMGGISLQGLKITKLSK